jgi:hypothetical protein
LVTDSVIAREKHEEDVKIKEYISTEEVGGGSKSGLRDSTIPAVPGPSRSGVSGPDVDMTSATALAEKNV